VIFFAVSAYLSHWTAISVIGADDGLSFEPPHPVRETRTRPTDAATYRGVRMVCPPVRVRELGLV
jgi:hypothetical protein